MSVKSRLLALKLLDKQKKNPQYAKRIGIEVNVVQKIAKQTYECVREEKEGNNGDV